MLSSCCYLRVLISMIKINDQSPIICASIEGHVNVVGFLLSKGANPNDTDNSGT